MNSFRKKFEKFGDYFTKVTRTKPKIGINTEKQQSLVQHPWVDERKQRRKKRTQQHPSISFLNQKNNSSRSTVMTKIDQMVKIVWNDFSTNLEKSVIIDTIRKNVKHFLPYAQLPGIPIELKAIIVISQFEDDCINADVLKKTIENVNSAKNNEAVKTVLTEYFDNKISDIIEKETGKNILNPMRVVERTRKLINAETDRKQGLKDIKENKKDPASESYKDAVNAVKKAESRISQLKNAFDFREVRVLDPNDPLIFKKTKIRQESSLDESPSEELDNGDTNSFQLKINDATTIKDNYINKNKSQNDFNETQENNDEEQSEMNLTELKSFDFGFKNNSMNKDSAENPKIEEITANPIVNNPFLRDKAIKKSSKRNKKEYSVPVSNEYKIFKRKENKRIKNIRNKNDRSFDNIEQGENNIINNLRKSTKFVINKLNNIEPKIPDENLDNNQPQLNNKDKDINSSMDSNNLDNNNMSNKESNVSNFSESENENNNDNANKKETRVSKSGINPTNNSDAAVDKKKKIVENLFGPGAVQKIELNNNKKKANISQDNKNNRKINHTKHNSDTLVAKDILANLFGSDDKTTKLKLNNSENKENVNNNIEPNNNIDKKVDFNLTQNNQNKENQENVAP